MKVAHRFVTPALIATLACLYFGALVAHPGHTLYSDHSDLIALHVPWETFLCRSWRESGEMPLWNPLQFAGLPLAHDIQAATSYPPHWVFGWVDPSNVGPVLSWLVVLHVIVAGWGAYAYARDASLGPTASLVAAIGFMFSGKWLLHLILAGHYAFIGLAWLPWAALGLVRAARGRSPLSSMWGGVAFGLMALSTHPQLTLYAGVFLAAWTLSAAWPSSATGGDGRRAAIGRCLGFGSIAIITSAGIVAAQLWPSLEMVPMTTRGVSGTGQGSYGSVRALARLLGPSPTGVEVVTSWEGKSGIGVAWAVMAMLAIIVSPGADRRRVSRESAITLGLIFFALGGSILVQGLPGFRLFREPGRMFLIVGFPMAVLVARTVQALLDGLSAEVRARAGRIAARLSTVLLALLVASVLSAGMTRLKWHPYWASLSVTTPLLVVLIRRGNRVPALTKAAWVAVLLADVGLQTWPHVRTRWLGEVLAPSSCAKFVAREAGPLDRVLERSLPDHPSSTPLGPAISTNLGLSQIRGYNPLDLVRFKEYLRITADPAPLGRLSNGIANFPILNKPMLDLLGVRFLVQPVDPRSRSVDAEPARMPGWDRVFLDPHPSAFAFAHGGIRSFPAYEVLENRLALPRAFVVPNVAPLPRGRSPLVEAFRATDFRRVALVEDPAPLVPITSQKPYPAANVVSYRPNRIEVEADGPGILVLTDPWFPGWTAEVDGRPSEVLRADYLFRGVTLKGGRHRVTFAFRPRSVLGGRAISLATVCGVILIAGIARIPRRRAGQAPSPIVFSHRVRIPRKASGARPVVA